MPNNTRSALMAQFALVIIIGLGIVAWPVHVSVFGSEGNCGPALVAWVQYADSSDGIERTCAHEGAQHSIVGGLVTMAGFIVLIVVAGTMDKHLPWWDGQQWRLGPMFTPRYQPPPTSYPPPPPGPPPAPTQFPAPPPPPV